MIVYPAIDLRGGRVVRLVQGDPNKQTIYDDDPVGAAQRWCDAGAAWLHVVNLDGALGEAGLALDTLNKLARVGRPIQFGGGMRSLEDARQALEAGAARIILGTLAALNPALAGEAVQRFGPDSVAIALDTRDGLVSTHGWQAQSSHTPASLGRELAKHGVRHALFTDIQRDGVLQGVNVEKSAALVRETGLQVIASGGVASLEDIQALKVARPPIAGVVIGKALYTGAFTLGEALAAASY